MKRQGIAALLVATMLGVGCQGISQPQPAPSGTPKADEQRASEANPVLKIGILQRFGSQPNDQVSLRGAQGPLILRFGPTRISADATTVRVQLRPGASEAQLVLGSHRSFESAEADADHWRQQGIATELAQPNTWEVWADRQRYPTPASRQALARELQARGLPIQWRRQPAAGRQLLVVQAGARRFETPTLTIEGPGGLRVDGLLYPGSLSLQPNAYGSYTLINQVRLEDYLRGVVPHELGPQAPAAAAAAQAVLARTYVLRNLRRFRIDGYELCADEQCQVYRGWQDPSPSSDRAIARSRGLVLTDDQQLIDALYSANSGGVTARFDDNWRGQPRSYLTAVVDSIQGAWDLQTAPLNREANLRRFLDRTSGFNSSGWPRFRWEVARSQAELTALLQRYLSSRQHPLARFSQVKDLRVSDRSSSGRALRVEVVTDRGPITLERDELRRAFRGLYSTLFYLEPVRQGGRLVSVRFIGGGFGHGAGLSQTGSYHLADAGWDFQRILAFYFPGTRLQPLQRGQLLWKPSAESETYAN